MPDIISINVNELIESVSINITEASEVFSVSINPLGQAGLPPMGLTGQVLEKKSNLDYDVQWVTGGGGAVDSVNGQTGIVVLTKSDIGLGNVDNTSDSNKPVSTDQATAIGLKQDSLVSGSNIKTINGNSILGSGDVVISGGGGSPRTTPISATFINEDGVLQVDVLDSLVTSKSLITSIYYSEDFAIQCVSTKILSITPGVGYSFLLIAPDGATGQIDLTMIIQEAV